MSRVALLAPLGALALAACGAPPPPPPQPMARVDTVIVTREVAPPLPEGTTANVCLAHGQNVQVRVSAAGDTLVGPRRVRLVDLGPAVGFVGSYAAGTPWFVNDEAVTFERRPFRKFGQAEARDCQDIKIIGEYRGVNVFAAREASSPFQTLYVPVRPGVFQTYQSQVGRVRG